MRTRVPNLLDSTQIHESSLDELAAQARAQGLQVDGNNIVTRAGGRTMSGRKIPTLTPLSTLQRPNTLVDQMGSLAAAEYTAKQNAANEQFDANASADAKVEGVLDKAPGQFNQETRRATRGLDDLLASLESADMVDRTEIRRELSKQADQSSKDRDAIFGDIDRLITTSSKALNTAADRAEAEARNAISSYDKSVDEDVIRNTVSGMRIRLSRDIGRLRNRLGPNGEQLTAEEANEQIRQIQFDSGQQIAGMAAGVRSEANKVLASLRTNLANVILEGGKMKEAAGALALQGEGLKLETSRKVSADGQNRLAALLASQEGSRAIKGIMADVSKFTAQLGTANSLASMQFQLQGRMGMSELVRNNPQTVVSMLSALLAIAGVSTAPGGRSIPAVRIG